MNQRLPIRPYEAWPSRLAAEIERLAIDPALLGQLRVRGLENFGQGGCAILAEAIRRALGPRARLVGIREADYPFIEHLVVECEGWYLDANGVRSQPDFLEYVRSIGGYREPVLVDFGPHRATHNMLPYPASERLVAGLAARLTQAARGGHTH